MKILLTGASGQLGNAIVKTKPSFLLKDNYDLLTMSRKDFDLTNPDKCKLLINQIKPEWVINCGAYTDVDLAEDNIELAMKVNAEAPKAIAEALSDTGGKLIQISTDYVFDGSSNIPIQTNAKRNPINIYGQSKAIAEEYLEKELFPSLQCKIVRTSWLMGNVGRNFALTMLKLHQERDEFRVVTDQTGGPTSTHSLSFACWKLLEKTALGNSMPNILHWSDAGVASWYDIAIAIGEIGEELGIISKQANITPITSYNYPTKALRPRYSLLDCFETREKLELKALHWRNSLKKVLSSSL